MARQKSLEDLRKELSEKEAELEKAKKKLEQVEHKMNRLQNKIKTESKKQRDARTHALCFKAGHLEYVNDEVSYGRTRIEEELFYYG